MTNEIVKGLDRIADKKALAHGMIVAASLLAATVDGHSKRLGIEPMQIGPAAQDPVSPREPGSVRPAAGHKPRAVEFAP